MCSCTFAVYMFEHARGSVIELCAFVCTGEVLRWGGLPVLDRRGRRRLLWSSSGTGRGDGLHGGVGSPVRMCELRRRNTFDCRLKNKQITLKMTWCIDNSCSYEKSSQQWNYRNGVGFFYVIKGGISWRFNKKSCDIYVRCNTLRPQFPILSTCFSTQGK